MPTSMPSIRYIGGSHDNDYVISSTGDVPYVQRLAENGTIQAALMSGNINLAEATVPKVMSSPVTNVHPYKIPVNDELVQYTVNDGGVQTPVNAENMPKHLLGWQAWNNSTNQYDNFNYPTLLPSVIANYSTQDNEIALYGRWEDVALIRVIVFLPFSTDSQAIRCIYTSKITAGNSYTDSVFNAYYKLSDNYKSVVDYWNPSYKRAIEYYYLPEYGNGDGCCTSVDNTTRYPTYFAVKNGDSISFEARMETGTYIPQYEMVQDPQSASGTIPQYHYYVTRALRCNVSGWEKDTPENFNAPQLNTDNKLCWTSQQNISVGNDVTIIVPLVSKPTLYVGVIPSENADFYAYIGTNIQTTQMQCMPNDTLTVHTYTSDRNAVFDGWYAYGSIVSMNQTYNVKVDYSKYLEARWTPSEPMPVTQPYVELSYLLVGADDTEVYNGTATVQYCTNGTTWTNLPNTNIVSFTHTTANNVELRCPSVGVGNLGTQFRFAGFREYFGNTRNPIEDTNLSEGNFMQGGSYATLGITLPYTGFKLTMSSLANNASYKVYAVYVADFD